MNKLVQYLKTSNKYLNDPNIKSLKAEIINENKVNIYLQLTLKIRDKFEKQAIFQVFSFTCKKILSIPDIKNLMNEGVIFNVSFYDLYNDLIISDNFDKNKISNIKKKTLNKT